MNLKLCYLNLKTSKPITEPASKLRGFIGRRFKEYPILHNHSEGGYIYTYPKVQYKIIQGNAVIVGIEEGGDALQEIANSVKELRLAKSTYRVVERVLYLKEERLSPSKEMACYRFVTPWLSLSQKNYEAYRGLKTWQEKRRLLRSILIGNILSMCKGLNYVVRKRLKARLKVNKREVTYKGISMTGFTGEFEVNFLIPDLLGIGKGTSQGFGTIKRIVNAYKDNAQPPIHDKPIQKERKV